MSQLFRNRSYVRVQIQNLDKTIASDSHWQDTGNHETFSEFDTLNSDSVYGKGYATLELNRWSLDGSWDITSGNIRNDGYISSELSDSTGALAEEVELIRSHEYPHDMSGVTVTFDSRADESPVEATINFYAVDTLVATLDVKEQETCKYTELYPMTGIDRVTITPHTLLPYRRFRLEKLLFGVALEYTDENLISLTQSHDVDPICRRLPDERLDFTIIDFEHNYDADNPQGIYQYVLAKTPVSVTYGYELDDGSIEWLQPDTYLLDSKPSAKNDRVTFSAKGLVNMLTGSYYKSMHGGKNLYDMAVEVLEDANLDRTETGENPWKIDESLRTMLTTTALPIDTHANCLQRIAHAARCRLYTDNRNVIHIDPVSYEINNGDFYMDFNSIGENSLVSTKIDELQAVSVVQYKNTVSNNISDVYSEDTDLENLHIEIPNAVKDMTVTVTGGTVLSQQVYARAVDLVMTSGTKHVTLSGKVVEQTTATIDMQVSHTGEIDLEQNPLITSGSMRQALARHVAEYLQYRNTYEMTYRGNPELETGDTIMIQTRYTTKMPALVLKDEITYNGALGGAVIVKGLIK